MRALFCMRVGGSEKRRSSFQRQEASGRPPTWMEGYNVVAILVFEVSRSGEILYV